MSNSGGQNLSVPIIDSSRSSSRTEVNSAYQSPNQLSSPPSIREDLPIPPLQWEDSIPMPTSDEEMQAPNRASSDRNRGMKGRKSGRFVGLFQPGGALRPFRLMKKEFRARSAVY